MSFTYKGGSTVTGADLEIDDGTVSVNSDLNRVGIGTTTPGAQLDVQDDTTSSANTGGEIRLSANDGAAMGDSHRLGVIEFTGAEDTAGTQTVGARIEALTDAAWTNAENGCALYFYTTDGNASQTNVLKLDSNQKATFSGLIQGTTATLSGLATFNGNATVLSGNASALSKVTLGTDSAKTTIGCPGGTDTFFTGTAAGDLVLRADDNNNKVHVGAGTSGKAAMVVTEVANVGKVGVGTASPGAQLDIHDTTTSGASTGGHLRLSANDGAAMGDSHRLGVIEFTGAEDTGGSQTVGARIEAMTEAAWSASENGGALYFYTTDGNASQSQVLKLDSNKKATFGGSLVIPDDGTIGSASDADAVKITAAGNLAHRGAVIHSTSTSDIDLTSTTHSTVVILDAAMAAGQAITLPQPAAALAGMVIDIHLIQDCTTSPNSSGPAIGLADGEDGLIRGALTLMSTGATMDTIAIPTGGGPGPEKALFLDSNAAVMAGGAAGSHYQFIYSGSADYVYVKGMGMTTAATPALTVYAFGDTGSGGTGTT